MAGTPATRVLRTAGVAFVEHEYRHDVRTDSYGLEAAAALGVAPDRVFKTLVAEVDGELVVGIVPVAARLDLKSLAAAIGGKHAALADAAVAERRTGYVRGGISPLGQRHPHRTVLDESAVLWDTVLVSGGRRGLDLELDPRELVRLTSASLAPIAR